MFSDSTRQQDKPNVAQKTPCRKVPGYLSVGPSARSQNMGLGQMSGEQRNGVNLKPGAYRGSHRKACPLATCLQLQNGQRANSKQWFPVNPKTLRATPPSSRPRLQHPHFFGFLLLPNSALLRNGAGPGLIFHLFNAEKYTRDRGIGAEDKTPYWVRGSTAPDCILVRHPPFTRTTRSACGNNRA